MRKTVVNVFACLFAIAIVAQAQTGPAGKWTGETQGRGGPQTVTLELKVTGGTVAGTWTQGEQPASQISNGKVVDAATITFSRTLMGRGGEITLNHTAKISGNEMTITTELPAGAPAGGGGRGGGRGGGMPITLKRAG